MARQIYDKITEALNTLTTQLPPEYYIVAGFFYGKSDSGVGIALKVLEDLFRRGENPDSVSARGIIESLLRGNIKDAHTVLSTLQKFPKQILKSPKPSQIVHIAPAHRMYSESQSKTDPGPQTEAQEKCLVCSEVIQKSREAWLGCHHVHVHCLMENLERQMQKRITPLHCPVDKRPLSQSTFASCGFSDSFRSRIARYLQPSAKLNTTLARSPRRYAQCGVCGNDIAGNRRDLDCHQFHHDCIQALLDHQIKQRRTELNCPVCGTPVNDRLFSTLLPQEAIDQFYRQMIESAIQGEMKACPLCGEQVCADQEVLKFDCPKCGRSSCYQCKVEFHIGQSCDEFRSESNKCPACRSSMTQNPQATHLLCRCGYRCCIDCRSPSCKCPR